jgi:hypothetical protein
MVVVERPDPPAGLPLVLEEVIQDSEAEYSFEYEARCPSCRESLSQVKVVRLLRTRVNFISTLPRRGHVMVCPACRAILSGELTIT